MQIVEKAANNKPLQRLEINSTSAEFTLMKKVIWVYFLLLLFEGALRKWFLPGLSQGLLIIRDPIAIWIYYIAYNQGLLSLDNKYIRTLITWTLICGLTSFLMQAHPLTIAYGMRTSLLHFPLIFVIARVLTWQDVISFGKAFLILALPMTWVVAQQFQSDRFDTINVAAGGTGHQMMTSGDKVRASGTFTFISGIVFYYCFTIAFIIYGFLVAKTFHKWMLFLGTGATFLAMVTAGSRSVIAESLQVFACLGFLAYFRPNEFGRITVSTFLLLVIGLILYSQIMLFQEGLDFLSMRFEEAANVEGNPMEAYFIRYWDIISSPWRSLNLQSVEALGRGGGYELDWDRHIYENGAVLGIGFIWIRFWITRDLLFISISAIKRNCYLAILLWGACAPVILFGILGQPTNLGFAAFGGGLCLAAAKKRPS